MKKLVVSFFAMAVLLLVVLEDVEIEAEIIPLPPEVAKKEFVTAEIIPHQPQANAKLS